jgi:hypothetical protein
MKRARNGCPRIEERAQTIEAKKPWLKLEMLHGGLGIAAKPKSVAAGGDPGLFRFARRLIRARN